MNYLRSCCLLLAIFTASYFQISSQCGIATHMEIAFRSIANFNRTFRGLDIRRIVIENHDALQAGAVYPDSFYNVLCYKGEYHSASETTHWMSFIAPALDYFNEKYKDKPIDEAGEKLLAFILGIIAHDVADVNWHSLGIDQGFVDTQAQVNFNGSFQKAHNVADPGGDAVNLYELAYATTMKSDLRLFEWYVPISDMVAIYEKIGIKLDENVVQRCAVGLMKLGADLERIAMDDVYRIFASRSPFLTAELNDYFLGGMNDMATWTMERWHTAFMYLEGQGKNCSDLHGNNPLYWICGEQPSLDPPQQDDSDEVINLSKAKTKVFKKLQKLTDDSDPKNKAEIEVKKDTNGGIYITEANYPKYETYQLDDPTDRTNQVQCDSNTYFVEKAYSSIGQSLLSADVNGDGYPDMIVSAPGYSLDNRFQEGRVFVVLGSKTGLPMSDLFQLEIEAAITFSPPFQGPGRFGHSVTVGDFNDDSYADIAISAPIFAPNISKALSSGQVYIFFGQKGGKFQASPDVTIDCGRRFCNLGTSLSAGDVNRDGMTDLIIGSPYFTLEFNALRQNGMVSLFYGAKTWPQGTISVLDSASLTFGVDKPYSWFGYSSVVTEGYCNMLIGAPATSFYKEDTLLQMAGAVYCLSLTNRNVSVFAQGNENFENFGSALTYGHPKGKDSPAVVAIAAKQSDNEGKLRRLIPIHLKQSGTVYFFDPTNSPGIPIGEITGDRHFARFGQFIQFVDANNDDYDDLIVGAPVRQPHLTFVGSGDAVGEAYVYFGDKNFPESTTSKRCFGKFNPCPGEQADKVFSLGQNKAQFGTTAAVFNFDSNLNQFAFSAPKTDDYSRQSGKVLLYSGC